MHNLSSVLLRICEKVYPKSLFISSIAFVGAFSRRPLNAKGGHAVSEMPLAVQPRPLAPPPSTRVGRPKTVQSCLTHQPSVSRKTRHLFEQQRDTLLGVSHVFCANTAGRLIEGRGPL